jgi:hypothetical protein
MVAGVSLISSDDAPYVVPDFTADAEIRQQYEVVAKQLLTAAIADALRTMREEHEFGRLRLEANKRAASSVLAALERHAHDVRSKYARLVPKQRTASGLVQPPTLFFDTLLTMGQANKLYGQAVEAAQLKKDAMIKVRSTSQELEKHMGKIETGLVVRELEVRKHFKSENGRLELDANPLLRELAVKCAAIELERADYRSRLEAGTVTDEERRDRTMAHDGYRYIDGNITGLHCLAQREVRFGGLRYLMLRDIDDKIWMLEWSLDMLPLTQMRFDVIYQNERYLIQRSAPPPSREGEGIRKKAVHQGVDPRAYMGVDPVLRQALKNFAAREKSA